MDRGTVEFRLIELGGAGLQGKLMVTQHLAFDKANINSLVGNITKKHLAENEVQGEVLLQLSMPQELLPDKVWFH